MNKLLKIFSRYYVLILFVFLQAISIVMIIQGKNYHRSLFISSINDLTGNTYSALNNYRLYFKLKQDNLILAAENAKLKSLAPESLVPINGEYFLVEDSLHRQKYRYRKAKIVHQTVNRRDNFIVVDLGDRDGVTPDMGIVVDSAVVGLIVEVSDHYAKALSFLNSKFQVSARIKRNQAVGILDWKGGEITHAALNDLPLTTKVYVGDTVVTSGFSAVFPKGIPLGVVTTVDENQSTQLLEVKISLFEDYNQMSHVQVVENLDRAEIEQLIKKPLSDD